VSGNGLTAAVVTVSDGVTHGTRKDESGDVAEALLVDAGFQATDAVVLFAAGGQHDDRHFAGLP